MSSSSDQENFQQDDSSEEEEVLSGEAAAADDDTEDEGESEAGVSEAEDSDAENNSEANQPALDASSTEDDDDEVSDDEDIPQKKSAAQRATPKMEDFTQKLKEKYEKLKGKQLFIRFPEKLPADREEFDKKVKAVSELIVTANKPRQKHARFCLVNFATTQDRDATMKKLKKHKEENKLEVSLPKTESENFINNLAEMRKKKIEKKRERQLLKKEKKRALKGKEFTSTICVLNIPKTASTAQIKELFPNAVDIQMKPAPSRLDGFSIATITLPTTQEASKNCKRNLSLGGTKLIIRFNNEKKKNKIKDKKAKKNKQQTEEEKGPIAPTPLASNGDKQKTKKKGNKGKKVKPPKDDEVGSPTKQKLPLSKKRESKDDDESKVPNKKAKLTKTPQQPTAEVTDPVAPKKQKKNDKFPQKKGNASPNKKVQEKKPNKQSKQKGKAQKKGKLAAE